MTETTTLRFRDLVLTVSYSAREGYEMLVEIDTDESATDVPVNIGNAAGDDITWNL